MTIDWSKYDSNKKLEVSIMTAKTGGKGNEPWYMSRRIWGAVLSAAVAVYVALVPEQMDLAIMVGGSIASALGISSWVKPKKQ